MIRQFIFDGLVTGCCYGLMACSLSLIRSVCGFFHLAHASLFAVGGYTVYFLTETLRMNLALALVLGVVVSGCVGLALDVTIYRPLRARTNSSLPQFLASFGVLVVIQSLTSVLFGDGSHRLWPFNIATTKVFGVWMTRPQLFLLSAGFLVTLLGGLIIRHSKVGLIIRAVSNDSILVSSVGGVPEKIISATFFVSSAVAGLAGILYGFYAVLTPSGGFSPCMIALIALIVGGAGSFVGATLGGVALGLLQHLSAAAIATEWQDAIVFAVLIVFLICRPCGLFGSPLRQRTI